MRLWRWLRRLLWPQRWFEIDTRRAAVREAIAAVCADGDFATTCCRPDVTVAEVAVLHVR